MNPCAILLKLPPRGENCSPETFFTHLELINEKRNHPQLYIWWETLRILDRASEARGGRGRGIDSEKLPVQPVLIFYEISVWDMIKLMILRVVIDDQRNKVVGH